MENRDYRYNVGQIVTGNDGNGDKKTIQITSRYKHFLCTDSVDGVSAYLGYELNNKNKIIELWENDICREWN